MSQSGRHRAARPVSRGRVIGSALLAACVAANVWLFLGHSEDAPSGAAAAAAGAQQVPGDGPTSLADPQVAGPDTAASTALSSPPTTTPATSSVPSARPSTSTRATPSKPVVIDRGTGKFTAVPFPAGSLATAGTGRTIRITVEVEGGLQVDNAEFAETVARVLGDPRSWQRKDGVRFVPIQPDEVRTKGVDLRIMLTSPDTTDRLCAPLLTRGQVSCQNGGKVVLNSKRWILGAEAYGTDVRGYRTYLVNHEVGHGIGHTHQHCPGKGRPAPVMMQQTYGLAGCTAWPWPAAKPA